MNGSRVYEIRLYESFDRSLDVLLKQNYKNDKKGAAAAAQVVEDTINALRVNPCVRPDDLEPWPRTMTPPPVADGFEFRKVRMTMPRSDGDARQGRLMYLFNRNSAAVDVFAVYTHKQYKGRPAEKDLEKIVKAIIEHRQANSSGRLPAVKDDGEPAGSTGSS